MTCRRLSTIRDRGATLVEYALLVALFAVVLIASVDVLQGSETDYLESSGQRIGMPDLDASPPTSTTTTTVDGGSDTTDPSESTTVALEPPEVKTDEQGNNWSATILLTFTSGGIPQEGVTVTGSWDPSGNHEETSCTTNSAGECSVIRWQLNKNQVDQATFTVEVISGTGYVAGDGVIGTEITALKPGTEPEDGGDEGEE